MTQKKRKGRILPEKIHLLSINIFSAKLDTEEAFLESPQRIKGFEFGIAHETAHSFEDKHSRFRLYFTMDARNEEEEPLGVTVEYGIEFHFYVENFQDFIIESEGKELQMDSALPATLLGMAYSTSRGIIFERTRGTFFEGVILPVIDPFKALTENHKG